MHRTDQREVKGPTRRAASSLLCGLAQAQLLAGWAHMPADTFADGPTSGQFAAPNPYGSNLPPYLDRQPVQGFSGVLQGPKPDVFRFLVDARTRRQLNHENRRLMLPIQADPANYCGDPARPAVDPAIRSGRLLTGADFDIEAFRRDHRGHYGFGDEFGPHLLTTDARGTVLRSEISMPGVYAPQHKDVVAGRATANLPSSGGFGGMAINRSGTHLYTLLERNGGGRERALLHARSTAVVECNKLVKCGRQDRGSHRSPRWKNPATNSCSRCVPACAKPWPNPVIGSSCLRCWTRSTPCGTAPSAGRARPSGSTASRRLCASKAAASTRHARIEPHKRFSPGWAPTILSRWLEGAGSTCPRATADAARQRA